VVAERLEQVVAGVRGVDRHQLTAPVTMARAAG
jgi:hypothetical protein